MYLQNMTNMFTLFLLIGVLATVSAQQLRGIAPQGTKASGLSSTRQRISDKLSELNNKLGGMRTDTETVMKAAGVPQVRLSACVSALDYCSTQHTNSHSFVSSLSLLLSLQMQDDLQDIIPGEDSLEDRVEVRVSVRLSVRLCLPRSH